MIDFGFTIQKDRQINYDSNSRRILEYVRKGEPSVDLCMSCGTCASGCTAANSTDFSLRKLILLARRGMEKELMESVFRCRFCGKCINACPRGVNTRNVIHLMQMVSNKISHHEI